MVYSEASVLVNTFPQIPIFHRLTLINDFMSLYLVLIHEVVYLYVTCPTLWCGMSVGPSPPEITNLTELGSRSIYLAWEAPKHFYRTIDHYYIEVRDTSTNLKQRRALENNEREVSMNSYVNKHKVKCHDYRFQVIYVYPVRFLILSAVGLKRNQSCKDCSFMCIWLMNLYILSVLSWDNTCVNVYSSERAYVVNECISNNVL